MKKLLLIVFMILSCAISSAQEHFTFKNIPIDGDISDFKVKMKSAGFTYDADKSLEGCALFTGKFMNRESDILVLYTSQKEVFKVVVVQEYSTWSQLSSAFDDAIELYSRKYGKPDKKYEFFSDPYYRGDGYELQALRMDKCHYSSFWFLPTGSILVKMDYFLSKYCLILNYEDKINQESRTQEREQKALDDI